LAGACVFDIFILPRFLEVLWAYAGEDDATVWGMVLEQLHGLHSLLSGAPELLAPFDAFARKMVLDKVIYIYYIHIIYREREREREMYRDR